MCSPALKAWGGKPENFEAGQRAYYHRAKMNSAARTGTYGPFGDLVRVSEPLVPTRYSIDLLA